jgi:hypothetical protein
MKYTNINILLTLIIHYKLLKVASYETQSYYNSPFCKQTSVYRMTAVEVKAHMDPCFTLISGWLITTRYAVSREAYRMFVLKNLDLYQQQAPEQIKHLKL